MVSKKGVKATAEDEDLLQLLFGQEEPEPQEEPVVLVSVPPVLEEPGQMAPEEPDWVAPEEPHGEVIVPMRLRATKERIKAGGWPGSCVNEDGVYIGGLGNFCPEYRPVGEPMCAAHRGHPDYQMSRLIPMELRIKPRSEWPRLIVELRAQGVDVSDDVLALPKRTAPTREPEEEEEFIEEAPPPVAEETAPRRMTMKEKQIAAKKKKSA